MLKYIIKIDREEYELLVCDKYNKITKFNM